ncbi:MAG TPA: glycoside hydrolase family 5 protein [Treponemataceae bacterium]|nr:glycoside hydrolase family 5 protein [Treponemataceae bacterium]
MKKQRNKAVSVLFFAVLISALTLVSGCVSNTGGEYTQESNNRKVFTDIPSDKIASVLSPGWNLGNQLEGVSIKTDAASGISITIPNETGYIDTKISKELLTAVKNAGFKFVRIPVSFFSYINDDDNYQIDDSWLSRIKEVVDMAIDADLYCMIDLHGDGYYTIKNSWLLCAEEKQEKIIEKYRAVWSQIALTFRDYDESVLFESMNEVFDGNYSGPIPYAYENINTYNEVFVNTVRETGGNNERRWLLIPGWNTDINATVNGFGTPGNFRMPSDDRLMVSVHYYDPWGFCGGENGVATQWGSFASNKEKVNGYEAAMAIQFNKLEKTFTSKGIPVVIGEWGSIDKTEDDNESGLYRAYYAQKLCENAKRTGCIPVIWDNGWNGKYGFALFNRGEKAHDDGTIKKGSVSVTQSGIIDAIMNVYSSVSSDSTASITLDNESITMMNIQTARLNAEISGGKGDEVISWSSSDETVAVVKDGQIVPQGGGTCIIIASLINGSSASCELKVTVPGGVQAKVYLFEGAGWSSVKSQTLTIEPGVEKVYEVNFNASKLSLENIAAMYLKDMEVEENHAESSGIESCLITVEEIKFNGISVPLVNNEAKEAVNAKKQLDLPFINEWAVDVEMVKGLSPSGHRNIKDAAVELILDEKTNDVYIRFKTLASSAAASGPEAPAEKAVLDPAKKYNAFFGLQAADSWVFRNSYGNSSYGGETIQFKKGLFDTENATADDGHVAGKITDAQFTRTDIEAGKTIKVVCTDFNLNDKAVTASALNVAMISTDIPFGLVEVTGAKLFFDGKQVNLSSSGQEIYAVDIDKSYVLITFINIWQTSLKTFGYKMPEKDITMEFTCKVKE